MGSATNLSILARILEEHGAQLQAEIFQSLPAAMRDVEAEIILTNNTVEITVEVQFHGEYLELRPLSLGDLCSRFPDTAHPPTPGHEEGKPC